MDIVDRLYNELINCDIDRIRYDDIPLTRRNVISVIVISNRIVVSRGGHNLIFERDYNTNHTDTTKRTLARRLEGSDEFLKIFEDVVRVMTL